MTVDVIYSGPNGAVAVAQAQNTTVSADYTVKFNDSIVTAIGAGTFTITLLPAGPYKSKNIVIKCSTTAPITVNAAAGEFIDSVSSRTLNNGEVLDIVSDGTKWIETAASVIYGTKIADNSIAGTKIADSTITGAKLTDDSITASKIATGAVGTSEINTSAEPTVNTIYTNNWFRSNGNTGWYNQTYGGGIYMTEPTAVRVYGGKNFYCGGSIEANAFYGYMYPTGIRFFPDNPGGGGGDTAIIAWGQKSSFTENCRLTIDVQNDSTDDVYINTNQAYLQIGGTDYSAGINIKSLTQMNFWYPNRRFVLQSDGNAVIYNQFDQAIWASGTSGSDIKLKENITPYGESGIEKINKLKVVSFNYIKKYVDSDETKIGFIAQDVEKIIPQAIKIASQNEEKTLLLHKEEIVPYLVKAVQEQQKQIEILEERIKKLEELINKGA